MNIHSIAIADQLGIIINCALAVILGSLIGWERDRAGKSAGPRTMSLVAGASATIVSVGEILDINAKFGDPTDRKSTRLNSSHSQQSRMPSSA